MEVYNFPGLIMGIIILLASLYGLYRAYVFYSSLFEGFARKLAFRVMIGFVLTVGGSIGVIIDSISEEKLWFVMAVLYIISYVILMTAVLRYLRSLSSISYKPMGKMKEIPANAFIVNNKEDSIKILQLLASKLKGVFVISRKQQSEWEKEYRVKPDRFLWLTRVERKGIQPTKLHVMLEEIVRFIKEKGGGVLVYIDSIEYLLLYNDFNTVAKFLFSLKDYIMIENSLLLLFASPSTLEEKYYKLLIREFEEITANKLLEEVALYEALPERKEFKERDKTNNHASHKSK